MIATPNYLEPCICGHDLNEGIDEEKVWRLTRWTCPKCGKQLASTTISDSPVAGAYALKTLLICTNTQLREDKGLPNKPTRVTFHDKDGNRVLWKDIQAENKAWEKKMGYVQRKPF